MRVILRPGHGVTPPAGPSIDYSPGEAGYRSWMRQRPGLREDDYTAEFCGTYLLPALVRLGHCVLPMRAIDPGTGQLDTTPTTVGPEQLAGLKPGQEGTFPRWLYNASLEGALRGIEACKQWAGSPWVYDPVAACQWEALLPDAGAGRECYLSIHQNYWSSPQMYGCNVLYYGHRGASSRTYSRAGRALGTGIYDAICNTFRDDPWAEEARIEWGRGRGEYRIRTGSRWGVAAALLWELRNTRRPAVLIELAFASNPEDADRMHDPEWCHQMAESIARGLSRAA